MSKINICGIPHTIKYISSPFNAGIQHYGEIDYSQAEILINSDCDTEIQKETLCHEILHGILTHLGYDELSADESFVNCLSNALYQSFTPKETGKR